MRRAAVFTLMRDEVHQLPRWWGYYRRHFDAEDIYILDHDSAEPAVCGLLAEMETAGTHVAHIHNDEVFDHQWLLDRVHEQLGTLLAAYEYVLFTDVDELVIPAEDSLRAFIERATDECYRCTGYQVVGDLMYRDTEWHECDKSLLTRVPLTYVFGYHHCDREPPTPNPGLFLYHLHRINYDEALEKNLRWARHRWNQLSIDKGYSPQNQYTDVADFDRWFHKHDYELEPWHPRLRAELRASKSERME